MRVAGTGPEFETVGEKTIVYSVAALEEYLAQRRARSTAERDTRTRQGRRLKTVGPIRLPLQARPPRQRVRPIRRLRVPILSK